MTANFAGASPSDVRAERRAAADRSAQELRSNATDIVFAQEVPDAIEIRCVVDVGELDAIGVPLRIAAGTPHVLLGPGVVAAAEYDEGRHRESPAAVAAAGHAHGFEQWTERIVTAVGIADPVPETRALMALGDGLLLHRLTVDPALALRPAIERAGRALAAPLTWLAQHPDGEDR